MVKDGTAERAQIPGVMVAGKTGTTESYGDAWFVGWTKEYTVAVWVGYPDEFKPMETEFQGEPVAGGTFPTAIWKSFMMSLLKIDPLPKDDGGDGRAKPSPTPGTPCRAADRRADRGAADRRRRDRGAADRHGAAADRDGPAGDDPGAHGAADGHRAAAGRSRRRPRRAPPTGAAARRGTGEGAAGAAATREPPARGGARPATRKPGGQGRETSRYPSAQNRHGSSAALVMPIRGPVTYSSGAPARMRDRAVDHDVSFSVNPMPIACVNLPGPVAELAGAARGERISARPSSGSNARIRTAAPTSSGSHTALSSAWMP